VQGVQVKLWDPMSALEV